MDKRTNTEPLIILSTDEVLEFEDGLTLLSYNIYIRIFVDTVSSDIVYCKPKMSKPGSPSTQIGILNMLPAINKGNQTRKPVTAAKEAMNPHSTTANETSRSSCTTVTKASAPVSTSAHNTTEGTSTPLEPMDIIGPLFCHKDKLSSKNVSAPTKEHSNYGESNINKTQSPPTQANQNQYHPC